MNIRFVSTLTPDDEERVAPGVLNALRLILDSMPLAYTIRIETANGRVFQHAHAGTEAEPAAPGATGAAAGGANRVANGAANGVTRPRTTVS